MIQFLKKVKLLLKGVLKIGLDFHDLKERYSQAIGFTHLSKENKRFIQQIAYFSESLLIIDVGALDGWFAKSVMRFNTSSKIISFEPLKSQVPFLEELKLRFPERYSFENFALGNKIGNALINEIQTKGLSSLKPLENDHYNSWGFNTSTVKSYEVGILTLDEYIKQREIKQNLFLKIDTQGYEMEVLLGARELLKNGQIQFISIELMTEQKYKEAKLYDEIISFLWSLNFHIIDINRGGYNVKENFLSEFDVIFKKF